jgi:short-subunit dehydrogenase
VSEQQPVAVVTGASFGIGYDLAKLCAENGHNLVIAADSRLAEGRREMAEPGSGER